MDSLRRIRFCTSIYKNITGVMKSCVSVMKLITTVIKKFITEGVNSCRLESPFFGWPPNSAPDKYLDYHGVNKYESIPNWCWNQAWQTRCVSLWITTIMWVFYYGDHYWSAVGFFGFFRNRFFPIKSIKSVSQNEKTGFFKFMKKKFAKFGGESFLILFISLFDCNRTNVHVRRCMGAFEQ